MGFSNFTKPFIANESLEAKLLEKARNVKKGSLFYEKQAKRMLEANRQGDKKLAEQILQETKDHKATFQKYSDYKGESGGKQNWKKSIQNPTYEKETKSGDKVWLGSDGEYYK